ncbi:MAG: hypothetical protein QXR42_05600 [Candidatus Bathyarchaeia archaeon]
MRLKFTVFMLRTQRIREKSAQQLQNWIRKAEEAVDECEGEEARREWIKIAGFLQQVLNGLLKAYDDTRFNEDLQQARKLLNEIRKKQEQLRVWEESLKLKEQELNRKLEVLQKTK